MYEQAKIWSLYSIKNEINGKIYIGQAADLSKRWSDHRRAVRLNKPTQIVHRAMIKYGLENFKFEVIVSCKNQDDANFIEMILIDQYESHVSTDKGYNVTLGGMNAPKTELFKQMMRDWHASLSPEEKARRAEIHRQNMFNLFATKGHPALGLKWTDEQKLRLSESLKALDKEKLYTPEVRKNMSEAHIGIKDSDETKQKKSDSAVDAWAIRIDYSRKCEAPGCEVSGKVKYKIINGVRYCNMHGLRMLRYGRLDRIKP
jgi:group I intron endonuclease